MGAADLLLHLRGAGLVLALAPAGRLHVAPRVALTDQSRAVIRAHRDALVLALEEEASRSPPPPSDCPPTRPEPSVRRGCAYSEAEIQAFAYREARFSRFGWSLDAGHIAERLRLRDRDGDDRRLCLECTWLHDNGRCLAAASGRLPGAARRLEPVQIILQRCEAFGLQKGLV